MLHNEVWDCREGSDRWTLSIIGYIDSNSGSFDFGTFNVKYVSFIAATYWFDL